jgi:hypothetical protein
MDICDILNRYIPATEAEMRHASIGCLLLLTAGCISSQLQPSAHTSMKLVYDNAGMKEETLRYLSLGMPIDNASRIMKDSGFDCDTYNLEPDRIRCHAVYKAQLMTADEIWVELLQKDGKLIDIQVRCQMIGV